VDQPPAPEMAQPNVQVVEVRTSRPVTESAVATNAQAPKRQSRAGCLRRNTKAWDIVPDFTLARLLIAIGVS